MTEIDPGQQTLVGRLAEGDDTALAALFLAHRERLRRVVLTRLDPRLRRRIDSSDVLQDAFLEAHKRVPHFQRAKMPFFVWLREIALQRVIDLHRFHLRARKRAAGQEKPLDVTSQGGTGTELVAHLAAAFSSPSEIVHRDEVKTILWEAVASMQPIDQSILSLRHLEELNNDEIAAALKISKSAASNRYARALRRLHQVLQARGFSDSGHTVTRMPPTPPPGNGQ